MYTIYNFLILQKKSIMKTRLTTLSFNMFIKKEADIKINALVKKKKSLN